VLPIAEGHFDQRSCLVNYVVFTETNSFSEPFSNDRLVHHLDHPVSYMQRHLRAHALELVLPHSVLEPKSSSDGIFVFAGYAVRKENGLVVKQLSGHAFSSAGALQLFQIPENKWGRIVSNRRSALQAGTVYEQLTINIAHSTEDDPEVFVSTKPAFNHERLNRLF
jgi:hypothetical protein